MATWQRNAAATVISFFSVNIFRYELKVIGEFAFLCEILFSFAGFPAWGFRMWGRSFRSPLALVELVGNGDGDGIGPPR